MSQFSLVTGFFEGTRQNILHIFRALDNKFWLFQVICVLQYMMRFSTVFEIIYRIMLGHSCLKVATLILKCHLKKPKIMLLVGLLFSIGTIIFEKIICRMYKCDRFEIIDNCFSFNTQNKVHFSMSKMIRIFLNFFSVEEYQNRGMFFVVEIFRKLQALYLL